MAKKVCLFCQNPECQSDRLLKISGKTSDLFWARDARTGREHDGYVPMTIGIAGRDDAGDYIAFTYCLECGQIQGKFPVKDLPKEKKA